MVLDIVLMSFAVGYFHLFGLMKESMFGMTKGSTSYTEFEIKLGLLYKAQNWVKPGMFCTVRLPAVKNRCSCRYAQNANLCELYFFYFVKHYAPVFLCHSEIHLI